MGGEIISFVSMRGVNLLSLCFIFFIHVLQSACIFPLFLKILTLAAREFLKQVSRIGNKWNELTLLAEGVRSPEGRNSDSRLRSAAANY